MRDMGSVRKGKRSTSRATCFPLCALRFDRAFATLRFCVKKTDD